MKNIILSVFFLLTSTLFAQENPKIQVHAQNGKLNVSQLKEGTRDYLVYFTDSTQEKRTNGDIWRRITQLGKHQGKDVIFFTWKAYANGKFYRETLNICDAKTLAPIHHKTTIHPIGDERVDASAGVYAYDFHADQMVPSDSIAANRSLEKGSKPITIPIISWEKDLETFPLLPITQVGEIFEIAFFDPNETETKYHTYSVIGKEKLKLNEDVSVDCWVLENREGSPGSFSKFFLSEKSKEVLKMEQFFRGQYRMKVLQY